MTLQLIDGDIDRPVIVGDLYGGADAMPFSAGIDAGVNHPGVIAGLHSQRLDGAGFDQFALDDAPGQLRTRPASCARACMPATPLPSWAWAT